MTKASLPSGDVWTLSQIASCLGQPHYRIDFILRSRKIEPVGMIGNTRVFHPDVLDRVERELELIEAGKTVATEGGAQ